MNGVHDLGGMQGFGPVAPEPETTEPLFHTEWERRAFALTLACGALGKWSLDKARFVRESMEPAHYLRSSYYEKWFEAVSRQLVETGLVTAEEMDGSAAPVSIAPGSARVLKAAVVDAVLAKGSPTALDAPAPARFGVGDRVRARNLHPAGHTRAPRYVRGHAGTVVLHHGGHVFADASASGERRGEHLYTVRFMAREIWGADAAEGDSVMVDLWEPHLEPA